VKHQLRPAAAAGFTLNAKRNAGTTACPTQVTLTV
jgi:hypothetical protein